MNMNKKIFLAVLLASFPIAAGATIGGGSGSGGGDLFVNVTGWLNSLNVLLFGLVAVAFTIGVVAYVFDGDKTPEKFNRRIIWPIIAMVVLASVWGIIKLVQSTLSIDDDNSAVTVPTLPVQGS